MDRLISPELRRNFWLELTPTRLVLMPAVLFLSFYLVHMLSGPRASVALMPISAALFFLITVLWGASLAASSLGEEALQRTWDWQRMSSITPWEITIGKLVGGPLYAWYGGLFCLAVFLVTASQSGFASIFHTSYWAGILVGIALLVHATALLGTSLGMAKYGVGQIARVRSLVVVLGIVALVVLAHMIDPRAAIGGTWDITWYGRPFRGDAFSLVSVYVFAAWAWIGLYQFFRAELGIRNTPWAFTGFAVFLMAYVVGFVHYPAEPLPGGDTRMADTTATLRLLVAAAIGGALTLGTLLQEKHDPVAYRRLLQGADRFPSHLIPRWSISLALTTGIAAWFVLFHFRNVNGTGPVIAAWLFLLRDTAVILALNLRASAKPADGLILVYLVVAYAILPGLTKGSPLFVPNFHDSMAALTIAPAIEAVLAAGILVAIWKRYVAT